MRTKTVDRARGKWDMILPQLGVAPHFLRNRHGPCPMCGGRDRYRYDNKDGNGTFYCNQCGAGTGLVLLMKLNGWDFATAAAEVDKIIGSDAAPIQAKAPEPDKGIGRRSSIERVLIDADQPDIAADYLSSRGLSTFPGVLKGHPALTYHDEHGKPVGRFPAMVAPVIGHDGSLQSAHRIYLADVPQRKKLMPPVESVSGGAVRLFNYTDTLGVAEGIETAVACRELFHVPTWAALTAIGLEQFEPPAGLERLVIYGDADSSFTGQKSAYALAFRLRRDRPDLLIDVELPPDADCDWLDVLTGGEA